MSNGTACCAAEICCDQPGARAAIEKELVAKGVDPSLCSALWEVMDENNLMFAHNSLRSFIAVTKAMKAAHD